MYLLKENKRVPINISKSSVVENFSVNWKSSKTWLIVGGISAAVILLVVLIMMIIHHKKSQEFY